MTIDATFWVAVSFFMFIGVLIYFKIPQTVKKLLDENILNIKNQINEAERLKEEAKNILSEHEKKISNSKADVKSMINKANEESERIVIKQKPYFPEKSCSFSMWIVLLISVLQLNEYLD